MTLKQWRQRLRLIYKCLLTCMGDYRNTDPDFCCILYLVIILTFKIPNLWPSKMGKVMQWQKHPLWQEGHTLVYRLPKGSHVNQSLDISGRILTLIVINFHVKSAVPSFACLPFLKPYLNIVSKQ